MEEEWSTTIWDQPGVTLAAQITKMLGNMAGTDNTRDTEMAGRMHRTEAGIVTVGMVGEAQDRSTILRLGEDSSTLVRCGSPCWH